MPSNHPFVCVSCRLVFKQTDVCPSCQSTMKSMHYSWRAPKRTNDRAWKLIEAGDFLWDKRAVRKWRAKTPASVWDKTYWSDRWARRKK